MVGDRNRAEAPKRGNLLGLPVNFLLFSLLANLAEDRGSALDARTTAPAPTRRPIDARGPRFGAVITTAPGEVREKSS